MCVRIENNCEYFYCSVDANPSTYSDMYDDVEECISDLTPDIKEDCRERGYNEIEIKKVIDHYKAKFENSSIKWGNEY